MRVFWAARRPNQSILKEISPEYSLEGLMLKLKPQYFGYLMGRTDFFNARKEGRQLGKKEGRRMTHRAPGLWGPPQALLRASCGFRGSLAAGPVRL